jgi:hypothetical protein
MNYDTYDYLLLTAAENNNHETLGEGCYHLSDKIPDPNNQDN